MVTLSPAFFVAFPLDSEKSALLQPFLLLLWQTDGGRGNKYHFLTVYPRNIGFAERRH